MEHVLGKLMELKWSDLFVPDTRNSGAVQGVLTIQNLISGITISTMIKKNSHGKEGVHSQRKTWTKRAINLKDTCPFYFYIAYDCDVLLLCLDLVLRNICITAKKFPQRKIYHLRPKNICQKRMRN